ncbi:MAG: sulfatase-like hydrolase/transferase [Bacteroides sp.]|nr:sulfatase-like hydrolase/transferase [Bacteroides sp.]
MRSYILIACLLLSAGLWGQKPNIVIIVSDDQSFNSIGYTSKGAVYTPTLDMLAENGMVFTNAHHPVTVCSPSRYSMLTGKYSGRCQGENYLEKFPPGTLTRTENSCELTLTEQHLGNILKDNGYTTGFVGKTHIMEHDILEVGNWASYGLQSYTQTADPYDPDVSAKMKHNHDVYQSIVRSYGFDYADGIYMANVKELRNDALNVHNLEWTVDKAREFIEQEKDNPFFLYFSTTLHHGPVPWGIREGEYWASFDADPKLTGEGFIDTTWDFMPTRQEIQDTYTGKGFPEKDAYALLLDEGVKAIYNKIIELNLDENTLIIFMPDHGMWRHGKATLYDYGLKVPMLMYWKGTITAGSVYDGLIQTVDFLPTLLEVAGIEEPAGLETDGISLKSIIETGAGEAHSSLFGELGYSRAVKTLDWKYIAVRYPEDVQEKIDRGETWIGFKGDIMDYPYLTQNSHLGYYASLRNPLYFELDQLFDLQADSAETVNVIDQHPEIVAQMREELASYLLSFENRPFGEFTLTAEDSPFRAHTPLPHDGATEVAAPQTLKWTSEYKTSSHDIYFGKTNPPPFVVNQESAEFDPGALEGGTHYYWRIDEKNAAGTTTGHIWSFETGSIQAGKATNPLPDNRASQAPKNSLLKWDAAPNAVSYNIHMGTSSLKLVGEVSDPGFDPGPLKSKTLYFWRVDAINSAGSSTQGDLWAFTTSYGNIAPEAAVSVSSTADPDNFAGENVRDGIFQIGNIGEWKSDGESTPWFELSWEKNAIVDKIHLYDRVGSSTQVITGAIEFSDGSIIETGTLPSDGSKKTLVFAPREISFLKFSVTEGIGEIGLAEIEVYDTVMYQPDAVFTRDMTDFQISPNPSLGERIMLKGISIEGPYQVNIYTITGKLSAAYLKEGTTINLDLPKLKKGVYFIQINNSFSKQTRKLIIS